MKNIIYIFSLGLITNILVSCEKDFIYDVDCKTYNNVIGGWDKGDSTNVKNPKDTTPPLLHIEVNEWGDTINRNINV